MREASGFDCPPGYPRRGTTGIGAGEDNAVASEFLRYRGPFDPHELYPWAQRLRRQRQRSQKNRSPREHVYNRTLSNGTPRLHRPQEAAFGKYSPSICAR